MPGLKASLSKYNPSIISKWNDTFDQSFGTFIKHRDNDKEQTNEIVEIHLKVAWYFSKAKW